MNLLVDTHVVIWFISDDDRISEKARLLIENNKNKCFVSMASLWELSIKHSLSRLQLNVSLYKIFELIELSGFEILPITSTHILTNAALDFHHRDPFDRLIIAQAKSEQLTLISKDTWFRNDEIEILWE